MKSTNKYLETLLVVNSISTDELNNNLGFKHGQLESRYKPASQIKYKYKLVVKVMEIGYLIPYHHRPKRRKCGVRYLPHKIRQYDCGECGNLQDFNLTPVDLIELGYSLEEIARETGLPAQPEVCRLLSEWDEEKEEEYICQLSTILGE